MHADPFLLLDYTRWANARVIDGVRQLAPDQLNAPIRKGWLSPLEVLIHMLAAERVWLSRWQGDSPDRLLMRDDLPTLDDLLAAWQPLDTEIRAFIQAAGDLDQIVVYRTTTGEEYRDPLWQLFSHVINHHTEHRAQVALVLAMHGIDTGNLDLSAFLRRE